MRQYRTFKLQEMLEIFALLIRYSLLKTASNPWRQFVRHLIQTPCPSFHSVSERPQVNAFTTDKEQLLVNHK